MQRKYIVIKLIIILLQMVKDVLEFKINRYRRGLETCPQAKTFKIERSATTLFNPRIFTASERRV